MMCLPATVGVPHCQPTSGCAHLTPFDSLESRFIPRVAASLGTVHHAHHPYCASRAPGHLSPSADAAGVVHALRRLRDNEQVGSAWKQVMDSMNRMNEYAQDLVQGEREQLFSINYWLVCQAPP